MSSATPPHVPADAGTRGAVLDCTQSWLLQAPAGSGKTELLMQRYLACLATVEQPESVLAITFTRKAAAEMRNRILESLEKAARPDDEEIGQRKDYEQQSLRLARAALKHSEEMGWKLLQHPGRLQVRTLDSFCEAVAQRAPFKGLLGGTAGVTDDAKPLYALAAERVVDELAAPGRLGDAVATLLRHVDNNVGRVRELLAAMLAQREQWLHFLGRSDVLDAAQQKTLRERLEAALTLALEEELALVRREVIAVLGERASELFGMMRYAAENLTGESDADDGVIGAIAANAEDQRQNGRTEEGHSFPGYRPTAGREPGAPSGDVLRRIHAWPAENAAELAAWRAVCDFLLTGGCELRKRLTVREGFPPNTAEQKTRRDRCVALLKEIALQPGAEQLCEALGRIRRLPDPRYTDAQWEFMRAVLEVLPRAAANLKVVFAEQGTIDFGEYAQRALAAIGQEGDPTELGLQLGYRIRHVLVDEFQDTNRVQVDLLARLLKTWEEDEACSVFCVGDPMQSIYSFREADVAIYQQARREGIGERKLQFAELSQNFRSQQKLVEWFNLVFPRILREESDSFNAVKYPDTHAETTNAALEGEPVAIKGFAAGDRIGEARHLAECVQRELDRPVAEGEKPATIAVLVRSRTHLPELVEALRKANIPYRAVKTDRLSDRVLVRDLEALRKALTDLADRTAWLAVLRAPWCGLALADLLELCRDDPRSTVHELLKARMPRLSAHAQAALGRCRPVLEEAVARRGRGSVRALVESTWLRLGGPACVEDREQAMRDAEAYFALLDAGSEAGMVRDAEGFAQKLHDLYAPSDTRSGIQVEIMPIHQAKGLQWDVVFLPALERRARQDDKSLLYWRSRRRGESELLLLGPMEAQGAKADKTAKLEGYLRDIARDCAREELKRLFYVAATRARKRLYMSAAVSDDRQPDANSMLRLLWDVPGMQEAFAPPKAEGPAEEAEESVSRPELKLRRLPADYVAPGAPEALQWSAPQRKSDEEEHTFEWVGELLPKIGVVAHSFLQRIALEGLEHWDAARVEAAKAAIAASLSREGVQRGELAMGVARVSDALLRTLEDKRGRWLLSPHEEDRCELKISALMDGRLEHVRVDRTFIEDGTRWLVDYKITEQLGGDRERFITMQEEKYLPDMKRYVRALHGFDSRPVRCALWFPLLSEFREVEAEQSDEG
jgi:ATP-dependent exoDNAse (exonuclease V) beta subunit